MFKANMALGVTIIFICISAKSAISDDTVTKKWAKEPVKIFNIQFGVDVNKSIKPCQTIKKNNIEILDFNKTINSKQTCIDKTIDVHQVFNLPEIVEYKLVFADINSKNNILDGMVIFFKNKYYKEFKKLLYIKYDKPTSLFENDFGAIANGEISTWTGNKIQIQLYEYDNPGMSKFVIQTIDSIESYKKASVAQEKNNLDKL